ncbi:hypothetical protein CCACVL1_17213 [Corchorus capsularis]|uniref:Uncharacterized protein n=1 Tax=Corchorus capsularis TaxID=210143 RepID=A0A1R3HTM7_COCAP|nr:hypothetical protein CCACVL1_17213 [Corchorus capsularis]
MASPCPLVARHWTLTPTII